ncbi:hypothetical protein BDP27DRAFT_1019742 [Rhodocollybia butyracea]|uniref:Uncharacterized protein n=1 Tax=Rhodocollybia butyracea TaxID=206335 RepID=A0A9P5PN91_9AGAR|nr:hypothetical protein BDP27DRAFT_1019742 [Rhodocollybia butyracea]
MDSPDIHDKSPSWPSLYNPRSELFGLPHHRPIQPEGFYLINSGDVFRFTLYWTLVFYIPVFVVFGLYAFFNLTFPPRKRTKGLEEHEDEPEEEAEELTEMYNPPRYLRGGYDTLRSVAAASPRLPSPTSTTSATHALLLSPASPTPHIYPPSSTANLTRNPTPKRKKKPKNARRSRVTFALLVLFTFLLLSLIGAVISSAIVGYILTGLYVAGNFFMSTWVPLLWAAISVMVGMLNVWPSVINLI